MSRSGLQNKWTVAAVALALGAAPPVAAQAVVGTVIELESGRPAVGAMVRLLDAQGPVGPHFLTSVDGRYRILAPGPGVYSLLVERIGLAQTRLGPVTLAEGETLIFDLDVEAAPVRLEGLAVEASGRRRCRLDGSEADETQLVWDEARKALAAATWTAREAGLGYQIEQRIRMLDSRGATVVDDSRSTMRSMGANTVRTLEPGDLAENGYVRDRSGFVYYYGPDASVLLSDPFLDTHCFAVVRGPEQEPHLLGLAFEPVRGHPRSDIEGVLWMDAATARLERVEFSYTDLPHEEGSSLARGEVRFLELADGRWIVRDWYIRAPILESYRAVGAAGVRTTRIRVASVQEYGSGVVTVIGPAGVEWESDDPTGRLRGVVFDSIAGRGLAGADVRLAGRGWRTATDDTGRWELANVPPGAYRIGFEHPRLDSLGVDPAWEEVRVRPDTITEVPLALPPLERLLARACGMDGGVVVGFVRDDAELPMAGVEVAVVEGAPEAPPVLTDAQGAYRLCGLPAAVEIRVEARIPGMRSRAVGVRTEDGSAVRVDLRLTPRAAGLVVGVAEPAARPALAGRVLDAETEAPVEGVELVLTGPDGTEVTRGLTNERGRFLLVPGPPGRYRLSARHLGYADVEGAEVEVERGTKRIDVLLSTAAIPLEEVVVEVEGRSLALDRAGFYERAFQGLGTFLEADEIREMRLIETGDLANRVPALVRFPIPGSASLDTTRRYFMFRGANRGFGDCLPAVFVDGGLVREGGPPRAFDASVPTLDELVTPDQIAGIELYSGIAQIPTRFNVLGSACGVIVIWTR